jgi:hypothetical protein
LIRCLSRARFVKAEVFGPHGRAIKGEEPAALEDAIDDGLGEIFVVKDAAPGSESLICGEDHRPLAAMTIVDHVEEHVCGVGAIGEVADLIHDEQRGMSVDGESRGQSALAECGGEIVDQLSRGNEEGVESVLDRTVGDGDSKVGLAAAGLTREDQAAAFGDEVGG